MKLFYTQHGIGKAKYVINFHDGIKKHKDGSKFYDIRIFSRIMQLADFKHNLLLNGYKQI